jgi:multidrug efflux system membrane fusion protein
VASRRVATLNLEFTQVRAPLDGRISRALVSVGDYVTGGSSSSTKLTTLVSQDPVYVYFDCDEQTYLRYGDNARAGTGPNARSDKLTALVARATDEGFPYRGVVDFVDNRIAVDTGTIRLRVVLQNAEHVFTPGLFVRVRLQGRGTARSLLVDEKAVLTDQDRKYVYVAKEGHATRRDIKLGRSVGRFRMVDEGLVEGDQVVVSGVQRLRPDMPIAARVIPVIDPDQQPPPQNETGHPPSAPAEPPR